MSYRKKSFGGRVSIIFRLQRLLAQKRCQKLGITETQIPFLSYILNSPGISQDEISQRYFIDKGATARQTSKLEKLGFIKKIVDPENQRKKKLFPTALGEELRPLFTKTIKELNDLLLTPLNHEEQELLFSLLDRITDNMIALHEQKDSVNEQK